MKFAEFLQTVHTDGMKSALLRALYNSKFVVIDEDQVGILAEAFGNTARVDGFTFSLDNRLITEQHKGELVVNLYEKQARQLIQKYFPRDEPVIELGGSIGVVACMVNRSLIFPDQHVVVEASPELIPTLKKNREINHCRFEIIEAAIAYDSPFITFYSNDGSAGGSLYCNEGQAMQVPTQSLQAIVEKAGFHHFNLISDIEGSEVELIHHEMDFIREHVDFLFMEVHSPAPGKPGPVYVLETLQANGFEMLERLAVHYCFRRKDRFSKS